MSPVDDTDTSDLSPPPDLWRPIIDAEPVTGQVPKVDVDAPAGGVADGSVDAPPTDPASPLDAPFEPVLAPPGSDDDDDGKSRRERRKQWRQEDKARRYAARNSVRFPIFTRSVLLWMLVFALTGVAFGASGAFWWANFNSEVSDLRTTTDEFEERSLEAQANIEGIRQEALADIDTALQPFEAFLSETQMLQLAATFSPAVYTVATLDAEGFPAVGTGFAVISDARYTYFVTSYTTVQAATVEPGPDITVRKLTEEIPAEVWNWDAERDLALIRVEKSGVEVLEWAGDEAAASSLGSRIFPISGLGGAGATLTTGVIIDQSAAGFQHTAPLGTAFQGGPIVTVDGKVLGVASLNYKPLGFDPGEIHMALPINNVCQKLLQCGGANRQPGAEGG
jgi:S1-C subfamily serine protease